MINKHERYAIHPEKVAHIDELMRAIQRGPDSGLSDCGVQELP
jgi:hypothetical protein